LPDTPLRRQRPYSALQRPALPVEPIRLASVERVERAAASSRLARASIRLILPR